MKIAVVYIFPALSGEQHTNYALRFLESYQKFPPGIDHESIVVINGAKASSEIACMFSVMPNLKFIEHDDSGWDIGGYQKSAMEIPCDMMVFFGGSTYLKRGGWLVRMFAGFSKHGAGLYGAMGNAGDKRFGVHPHIRTTGFWTSPKLMNDYPQRVTEQHQRYKFEHGEHCLSNFAKSKGYRVMVVSWSGEYPLAKCDEIPNGFHRGNQSNVLVGDRLTEPPFYPIP